MEVSILAHTTATTYPCRESIVRDEKLYPGESCISKETRKKLKEFASTIPDDIPNTLIIKDYDLIPNNDETIIKLLKYTGTSSELALLHHSKIISFLGTNTVLKEVERFKPSESREMLIGSYDAVLQKTLVDWSLIFPFFKPLEPSVDTKFIKNNVLSEITLADKLNEKIKCIAILLSITTLGDNDGWHSVCIFVDTRNPKAASIEYFDAGSSPPDIRTLKWMEREKCTIPNCETITVNNKLIHQYDSTSCGMFSMIFIRRRLEGIPYEVFSHVIIKSTLALDFRRYIYSA